jgi:hypothetical protein
MDKLKIKDFGIDKRGSMKTTDVSNVYESKEYSEDVTTLRLL